MKKKARFKTWRGKKQGETRAQCETERGKFRTRRGAASFYVVAFTTLLFAVLAISFIRLMVYETNRTMNSDLSNSAYDSALAGVEDAKVALLKYHDCLNKGYTADKNVSGNDEGAVCKRLIWQMQDGITNRSCDTIGLALGRISGAGGEVAIEEDINAGADDNNSTAMQQAYTCVKVDDTVSDYKAELNNSVRQKVVPLRASETEEGGHAKDVRYLQIEWSWEKSVSKDLGKNRLASKEQSPVAALMFDVIQTDETFTLGELSANNANGEHGDGTDHFALFLQPGKNIDNKGVESVNKDKVLDLSDKNNNEVVYVKCTGDFNGSANSKKQCALEVELPPTYNKSNNRSATTFLSRVQNLYGLEMEFSLKMLDSNKEEIKFAGVQAVVDSTGRANDLYRRVESRIDFDDLTFPYPEFELQLTGDSNTVTGKNFYVTEKCWTASGGTTKTCSDYDTL